MRILTLVLSALIFFSCQKDDSTTPQLSSLKSLEIDELLHLLPLDKLESNNYAVFYNSAGHEKLMNINVTEETKEKNINSIAYSAERLNILYTDTLDPSYSLSIIGSGNYTTTTNSNLYLYIRINQFLVPYTIASFGINEKGEPIACLYYDQKDLLDQTFSAVYSNTKSEDFLEYGEIYFNTEYGIIGFKDKEGELYVFKEFRE